MKAHRVLSAVIAAGLAMLAVASVSASELYIYEHNGSVIEWAVNGEKVVATYRQPRPGLIEAGAHPGSVIFEGAYNGERIEGIAYVFKKGCPPYGYDVAGQESGGSIILDGPSPKRTANGCGITGYTATGQHSRLVFTYSATSK